MRGWEDIEREWERQEQENAREDRLMAIAMAVLFGAVGYLLAFLVLLPIVGWFFQWAPSPTIIESALLALGGAAGGATFGYRTSR